MRFEEIHKELLGQHNEIREVIGLVRSSERADCGTHLTRLRDLLVVHNAREEELLGRILPKIDAWGEVRALHMSVDHEAEHRSILHYVEKLERMDKSADVLELTDSLIEHLDDEEKTYMNAKVLRDDIVAIGHTGG
jgi:hypothetical protein